MNPWFLVSNDLLLSIYKKSIEHGLDKECIEFTSQEIINRNLRVDKPERKLQKNNLSVVAKRSTNRY
ncbi:sporulation histidine kinase inhibitor Sda [Virgibacillus salexigens]|uniref:Sporulation histidine kinase inhibitor Sda n=1 Tax=Virgibacillus kapii TaxID=1638645 RepID=A0ABQ2DY76_9BACI|nr:hypothetical protein GCM10007111_44250 [Virgibacillus kapii]